MDWIDKLDKCGYNFLIDELVYHLERPSQVVAVAKSQVPPGYVFQFNDGETSFLKVLPKFLDEHWTEAQRIAASFPEFADFRFI